MIEIRQSVLKSFPFLIFFAATSFFATAISAAIGLQPSSTALAVMSAPSQFRYARCCY
jgi:ABC-type methionine transport system permease subunit